MDKRKNMLAYCFELNDRKISLPIPAAYDPAWFKPSPDPWKIIYKPDPTPWILDKLLSQETIKELFVLATLTKAAEELRSELRGSLHQAIMSAVKQLPLPAEVTVEIIENRPGELTTS